MELKKRMYTEDEVVVEPVSNSLKLTSDLAGAIKDKWQKVKETAEANDQEIWDDPMQRFEELIETDDELRLRMSQTYFSTRYSLRSLLDEGKTSVKTYGAYVHCLTETNDEWYVFGEKSGKYVSDHKHTFIGGVLDYDGDRPRTPFEVARIELSEEAGVDSGAIDTLKLVGMYESNHGSIGMTMAVRLSIGRTEILDVFAQKTDKELAGLAFVRKDEVIPYMRDVLQRGEAEVETVRRYIEG